MAPFLPLFSKSYRMNTSKLEKLFSDYEKAADKLDLKSITKNYPDTFISAGPKGTIAQNKAEFNSKAEQAAEMYRSIGQTSMKIISKKITPISNEYTMVTVHWGATFKKTGDEVTEFDVSYIVQDIGDDPKIILFITHQDEAEAMKKLGLKPEMVK
jgi:hypothetical protein